MEILWTLFPFAFIASFTPGPNNILCMSQGINYGLRSTIPYQIGAGAACTAILLPFFHLSTQLAAWLPAVTNGIKYLGCAYMIFLAGVVFRSTPGKTDTRQNGRGTAVRPSAAAQTGTPYVHQHRNPAVRLSATAPESGGNGAQPPGRTESAFTPAHSTPAEIPAQPHTSGSPSERPRHPDKIRRTQSRHKIGMPSGFMLQFVNPKFYFYAATLSAAIAPTAPRFSFQVISAMFFAFLAVAGMFTWAISGSLLQHFLRSHYKAANTVMAIALIYCSLSLLTG